VFPRRQIAQGALGREPGGLVIGPQLEVLPPEVE